MRVSRTLMVAGLLALVTASLLVSGRFGIVRAGELRTGSRSVALDGAKSVQAEVDVDSADLRVSSGPQEDLLNARFASNVAGGKPHIDYDVSGDRGTLEGWQSETGDSNVPLGAIRREWDLRLSDQVALDELTASTDLGDADLDLAALSPSKLNVKSDTGDLDVNLAGDWKRDLKATIQRDVGEIAVRVPRDVGVRIDVDTGVGDVNVSGLQQVTGTQGTNAYVNEAFGKIERTLRIQVNSSVGDVDQEAVEQ
jgi:hypothetical protein